MNILDAFDYVTNQNSDNNTSKVASLFANSDIPVDVLLKLLLGFWGSSDSELGQDMRQKYIDLITARSQTADERAYNEAWRDNERAYNSPGSLLSRLLAIGMSRDAALQMLSGGSSSGSSAPVINQLPLSASNPSAFDQANLDLQRKSFVRDTIFGAFSTASNLVGIGFSAKQAISSSTNLDVQSALATQTIQGAQQGASVMRSLTSLASSQGLSESEFDSKLATPLALRSWLSSMPDNPIAVQALRDYDKSQSSVFGQRGFKEAYDSYIAQRGYKFDSRDAELRNRLMYAELALKDVSVEQVQEGIMQAWSEIDLQIEKLGIDRDLASSQIDVNDEMARLTNAKYIAQDQSNTLNRPEVDAAADNYESLYQMHARDIFMQFAAFESYYGVGSDLSKSGFIDYIQRYENDESFKSTAAAIAKLSSNNTIHALLKRENSPALQSISQLLECMRLTGISSAMQDVLKLGIDTYQVVRPVRQFGKIE